LGVTLSAYLTVYSRRSRARNSRLIGVESQSFAVPSPPLLPVTIREPSGLNDADVTGLVCPLSVRTSDPLCASQTLAIWSELPVTIREPSGLNDADVSQPVRPLSVRSSAPDFASQTLAVWSILAVTTRNPSGLNDAALTILVCPLRVRTSAPLL